MKGNKLIAEFMGISSHIEGSEGFIMKEPIELPDRLAPFKTIWHIEDMNYDKSWDWLMPVLWKIDTMGYAITISRYSCNVKSKTRSKTNPDPYWETYGTANVKSDSREPAYRAVVDFIKWYNQKQGS